MAILNRINDNRNFSCCDELVYSKPLKMDTVHSKHHHRINAGPVMPMEKHKPKRKFKFLVYCNHFRLGS